MKLTVWNHPSHYAGFSPDGDYLVLTRHLDSSLLDESNWDAAHDMFERAGYPVSDDTTAPVYSWRAIHSLVGWIEYLMVRQDAPTDAIAVAQEIADSLDAYPALDEDDWSQREYDYACDCWQQCSVRDRIDMIRSSGSDASIFAARHDYIPSDNGSIQQWLIG